MPSIAFALKEKLESANIEVIYLNYVSLGEKEINQHTALAEAINPDAYVFLGYTETGLLMKKYRQVGLKGTFYAINTVAQKTAEGALEGSRILQFTPQDGIRSLSENFVDKYRRKYQSEITQPWIAFQAYDAINILLHAIKGLDDQEISVSTLREQLLYTRDFEGVSGVITIDPNGSSHGIAWSLYNFENGKFIKK